MVMKIEIKLNLEDMEKLHLKGHFIINGVYCSEVTLAGVKSAIKSKSIPELKETLIT